MAMAAIDQAAGESEHDSRLIAYLEDRIQTVAELDAVDDLLESIKSRSDLLAQQLVEARRQLSSAREEADNHSAIVQNRAAEFQKKQRDIDSSLKVITRSEASDDALESFNGVLLTLRRLDNAAGYVDILEQVEAISKECEQKSVSDMPACLDAFDRLQDFTRQVVQLQETAEGAAPHMVDHVLLKRDACRLSIQRLLTRQMQEILKRISWPKPNARVPPDSRKSWLETCRQMLRLQHCDLAERNSDNRTAESMAEPIVLLPVEILVEPLRQRFRYHFSGDRITNRIDKPDFFLRHVLDLIGDYSAFFQAELQSLLVQYFHDSGLAHTPAYLDATSALINALLPMLQTKLAEVLLEVSKQPSLLSNLVHEVIWFDQQLAQDWAYTPLSPMKPYRGLAHFLLGEQGAFKPWLAAERKFALARYDTIIANADNDKTDFEAVPAVVTKPTTAAIQIKDLLETITQRYKPLASFSHKINFLVELQISIVDLYHAHLYEKLRIYQTDSTWIGGRLSKNSATGVDEVTGLHAPEYLVRVLGACEYLEQAMRDWSDDVVFLELWEELQYRTQNQGAISGEISMADVAAKTSATLAARMGDDADLEELQGALFDEPVSSYRMLRVKTEKSLIELLAGDFRGALQGYTRISDWASLRPLSSVLTPNAELDGLMRLLERYLGFLGRALSRATLRRLLRPVGHGIGDFFFTMLMQKGYAFSAAGAAQLALDVHGLWAVIDRYVGQDQGRASMRRLSDALTLLTLPLEGQEDDDTDDDKEKNATLRSVEQSLADNGEGAELVLRTLGIDYLSALESKQILWRRIELSTN